MVIKPYQILVGHLMPSNEAYVPKKEHKHSKIQVVTTRNPNHVPTVKPRKGAAYFSERFFWEFMEYVAASIDRKGWVSSQVVNGKLTTTANAAWNCLWFTGKPIKPQLHHAKLAKQAVKWAAKMSDNDVLGNTYLGNIRVIARGRLLSQDTYKHAASIINAYNKMVLKVTSEGEAGGYSG